MSLRIASIFFFCLILAIGCGDDDNGSSTPATNAEDHPHFNKCTTSCANDHDACSDNEIDQCVTVCLARTEDLEGTCATCVSEGFGLSVDCDEYIGEDSEPELQCSCHGVEGSITSAPCQGFCE